MNLFTRLVREEAGQGLAEYALILVLISIVAITTMGPLGTKIKDVFTKITTGLTTTP